MCNVWPGGTFVAQLGKRSIQKMHNNDAHWKMHCNNDATPAGCARQCCTQRCPSHCPVVRYIYPIHRVDYRAGSSDRLLREHNPSIDRIILCNTLQLHTTFYLQHWCTIALSQLFKLPMMIRGVARRKMVTHLIFLNGFSIDHSWPLLSDDDYWWSW